MNAFLLYCLNSCILQFSLNAYDDEDDVMRWLDHQLTVAATSVPHEYYASRTIWFYCSISFILSYVDG